MRLFFNFFIMVLQDPIKDDENLEDLENDTYDEILEFEEIEKAEEKANLWNKVQTSNDENRQNDWDYDIFDEEYYEN